MNIHLFLSVREHEIVDKAAQCKQFGEWCETDHCQEFQKEIKYLQYFLPELKFEGKVVLGKPDVTTEYQHDNTLT